MWKSAVRAPSLRVYPGICLTTEEKAWKNLSQGCWVISVYCVMMQGNMNIKFTLFLTHRQQSAFNVQHLIQGLPSIAAPNMTALPHKEPSSTDTSPLTVALTRTTIKETYFTFTYLHCLNHGPVYGKHTFPLKPLCSRKT